MAYRFRHIPEVQFDPSDTIEQIVDKLNEWAQRNAAVDSLENIATAQVIQAADGLHLVVLEDTFAADADEEDPRQTFKPGPMDRSVLDPVRHLLPGPDGYTNHLGGDPPFEFTEAEKRMDFA